MSVSLFKIEHSPRKYAPTCPGHPALHPGKETPAAGRREVPCPVVLGTCYGLYGRHLAERCRLAENADKYNDVAPEPCCWAAIVQGEVHVPVEAGQLGQSSSKMIGFNLRSDGVPCPQIYQREREELWCTEQPSCASLLLQHARSPRRIVSRDTIALIRDVDRGNVWLVLFFHSENCGTNSKSQEKELLDDQGFGWEGIDVNSRQG